MKNGTVPPQSCILNLFDLKWNKGCHLNAAKGHILVGNSHFPNPVKSNGLVFASLNLKHYISLCSSLLDLKWFFNAVIWFHHQKARSGDTGKWCYQLFLRHNTVVCFKRLTVVLFKGIMKFFSASYYELLFCGSVLSSNDLI